MRPNEAAQASQEQAKMRLLASFMAILLAITAGGMAYAGTWHGLTGCEVAYDGSMTTSAPLVPIDQSGEGNNSDNFTAHTSAIGKHGDGFVMDGANPEIRSPLSGGSSTDTNTWAAWIQCSSPATSQLLLLQSAGGTNQRLHSAIYASEWSMGVYTVNYTNSTDVAAVEGTWTHIALVNDGTNVKQYIDGDFAYQMASGSFAYNYQFKYGGYSGLPAKGYVDEIVRFNRALTEAEVNNLMYTPTPTPTVTPTPYGFETPSPTPSITPAPTPTIAQCYVSDSGSDANDGYSPANAWRSQTKACASAPADSLVWFRGGDWFPAGDVDIVNSNISWMADTSGSVAGWSGTGRAILDGEGARTRLFQWSVETATFAGFSMVGAQYNALRANTSVPRFLGVADCAFGNDRSEIYLEETTVIDCEVLLENSYFDCQTGYVGARRFGDALDALILEAPVTVRGCKFYGGDYTAYRSQVNPGKGKIIYEDCISTYHRWDLPAGGGIPAFNSGTDTTVRRCYFDHGTIGVAAFTHDGDSVLIESCIASQMLKGSFGSLAFLRSDNDDETWVGTLKIVNCTIDDGWGIIGSHNTYDNYDIQVINTVARNVKIPAGDKTGITQITSGIDWYSGVFSYETDMPGTLVDIVYLDPNFLETGGIADFNGYYFKLDSSSPAFSHWTDNSLPSYDFGENAFDVGASGAWGGATPTPDGYKTPTPSPSPSPSVTPTPTPSPTMTPCGGRDWVYQTDVTNIIRGFCPTAAQDEYYFGVGLFFDEADFLGVNGGYGKNTPEQCSFTDLSEQYNRIRILYYTGAYGSVPASVILPEGYYFDVTADGVSHRFWSPEITLSEDDNSQIYWASAVGTDWALYSDEGLCELAKGVVTPTATPTPSPTMTPTPTPPTTPTPTPSPTVTPSVSPTMTPTPSPSPSPTVTPSPTPTVSPTPTTSPSPITPTPSPTAAATATPTPIYTPTPIGQPSPTPTAAPATPTPIGYKTPTPTPIYTPTPKPTPAPVKTPVNYKFSAEVLFWQYYAVITGYPYSANVEKWKYKARIDDD